VSKIPSLAELEPTSALNQTETLASLAPTKPLTVPKVTLSLSLLIKSKALSKPAGYF
jgi:hypothetical protein